MILRGYNGIISHNVPNLFAAFPLMIPLPLMINQRNIGELERPSQSQSTHSASKLESVPSSISVFNAYKQWLSWLVLNDHQKCF